MIRIRTEQIDALTRAAVGAGNAAVAKVRVPCALRRERGKKKGARKGPTPKPGKAKPRKSGFASQDAAAKEALRLANPKSIKANLEYGGLIYKDSKGEYGFSGPVKGTDQGFNPASTTIPKGTTLVGDYHTHADYSTADPVTGRAVRTSDPARDDFNSDNFSAQDRRGIANDAVGRPGYRGYLGTPSGTFKVYDPATGKTSTL